MVRRGSALAGPGAPGGPAPGPNPALEATPGLSLWTFIFVGVLLVLCEPATSARAHPPVALRKMESNFSRLCHAGYFLDETRTCRPCQEGVDYTNHSNNLSSCRPCSICRNDKEEKSPCTTTRDAECQCRPGTFQDQNSPEYCRKCSDRCLDGMVEESPCGPWSDRKCVNKDSDHRVIIAWVIGAVALIAVVGLIVWKWKKIVACVKTIRPGCRQHSPLLNKLCPLRGPEAQDNDHNENISSTKSPSTLDIEQQREGQPLVTVVPEEFLEEKTSPRRPAETERSPTRRPLIPAKGTDTVETLRDFFRLHDNYIPYKSWDKLMRLLGLTDNEILVIKDVLNNREDALYEMMVKWLNKMGRDASINTLLDALETLKERNAREKIEDYMVKSGKFIYQEDGGDSAGSFRKST